MLRLLITVFISIFAVASTLALLHISEIRRIEKAVRVRRLFLVLIGQIVLGSLAAVSFIFNIHRAVLDTVRHFSAADATVTANEHLWVDGSSNEHHIQGMWWVVSDSNSGGVSRIKIDSVTSGKICVSGNVAFTEGGPSASAWGAKLELNLCMNGSHETPPGKQFNIDNCPRPIQGLKGFKMAISGDFAGDLRLVFNETDRPDSAYVIAQLTGKPEIYEFKNASVLHAPAASGTNPGLVESLSFYVVANSQSSTLFDFCVSDLEPLF